MSWDDNKKRWRASDRGVAKVMEWRARKYKESEKYREKHRAVMRAYRARKKAAETKKLTEKNGSLGTDQENVREQNKHD